MNKDAAANVTPIRQANQYSCMVSSLQMCLRANGVADEESTPDLVNKVMGAMPMHGASWEQAFAASQHYGMRVTFICPATLRQVKEYTDRGIPVMIAWNPEGRPWGHASVIFDVDEDLNVKVADPNCPDSDQTVRIVPKTEFYGKWYEKFGDSYLIRREAMAVEREITPDGRQMVAARKPIRGYTDQWGNREMLRLAKQLTKVFVVRDPDDLDTSLGDIVFSVTPLEMSEYVVGTGPRRWRSEHTALYEDEKSALDDAKARIKKLHGGKPPEHLLQPAQVHHLRAAKAPQPVAPPKKDDKTLHIKPGTPRNEVTRQMLERGQGGAGGAHRNRDLDVAKGRERHEKHKKDWQEKDAGIDWKGVAKKLLAATSGTTQDDLHYRAYLREVIAGRPADHLAKKFKGAMAARQDLIDNAGKTAAALTQPLSTRPDYGSFTGRDEKTAAKTEVEKAEKPGQWNLKLYKSRATRWDYFLSNPQGGGQGSTSYKSAKAALLAAISRVNFKGVDKIWVIEAIWDPQVGDYKVTKTTWFDLSARPDVLRIASAYLRKNIGD